MTVFGIDLSLTSTGVASFDGETWDVATIRTKPGDGSPADFLTRVEHIASSLINWCDPRGGDLICIEGPALHAKSSQLDRIFGAWWLVYAALTAHHDQVWVIPPTVVKQVATGRGNASKDQVLLAATQRLTAPITGNDTADAAWLTVTATHIQGNGIPLPQTHLTGLTKLITKGNP